MTSIPGRSNSLLRDRQFFHQLGDGFEVVGVAAFNQLEEGRFGRGDGDAGLLQPLERPVLVGVPAGIDGVVGDVDPVAGSDEIEGGREHADVGFRYR